MRNITATYISQNILGALPFSYQPQDFALLFVIYNQITKKLGSELTDIFSKHSVGVAIQLKLS